MMSTAVCRSSDAVRSRTNRRQVKLIQLGMGFGHGPFKDGSDDGADDPGTVTWPAIGTYVKPTAGIGFVTCSSALLLWNDGRADAIGGTRREAASLGKITAAEISVAEIRDDRESSL
jgi:hypothetical protein